MQYQDMDQVIKVWKDVHVSLWALAVYADFGSHAEPVRCGPDHLTQALADSATHTVEFSDILSISSIALVIYKYTSSWS